MDPVVFFFSVESLKNLLGKEAKKREDLYFDFFHLNRFCIVVIWMISGGWVRMGGLQVIEVCALNLHFFFLFMAAHHTGGRA